MQIAILAKPPVAGHSKTRLIGPLTAGQAAEIHAAMVHCTLERVAAALGDTPEYELLLALDRSVGTPVGDPIDDAWLGTAARRWRIMDQGTGDLGERLDRLWCHRRRCPTLFLGTDCPDVPRDTLRAIPGSLSSGEVCIGPAADGGYWTLGARQPRPELLVGIDWGTASVYHQTLAAARRAGLPVSILGAWSDVDTIDDLSRLRQRLADADERPLSALRQRLDDLLGGPQR